jgi:hypothetical protein
MVFNNPMDHIIRKKGNEIKGINVISENSKRFLTFYQTWIEVIIIYKEANMLTTLRYKQCCACIARC